VFRLSVRCLSCLGWAVGSAAAQDLDDYNGPMSNLRFVVVKDANGKPVRNAAVVLHPVKKNGSRRWVAWN